MIYENICLGWRAYRTHGKAFYLKMVVAVEHKVVQGGIRAKNVITFVATFLVVCLSFTTFIPSAFGILVYKNLTSRDTKWPLSGTDFIAFSLSKKSVVSFTCDGI